MVIVGNHRFSIRSVFENDQKSQKNEYNFAGSWVSGVLFPGGVPGGTPGRPPGGPIATKHPAIFGLSWLLFCVAWVPQAPLSESLRSLSLSLLPIRPPLGRPRKPELAKRAKVDADNKGLCMPAFSPKWLLKGFIGTSFGCISHKSQPPELSRKLLWVPLGGLGFPTASPSLPQDPFWIYKGIQKGHSELFGDIQGEAL
jgi:hypothetical protein